MSKGRIFLLAIGAALLIGATGQSTGIANSHTIRYSTPRVAANQTMSPGIEIRYFAAVSHGLTGDRREISFDIVQVNSNMKNLTGTPEQIERVAAAIVAAGGSVESAPRTARFNGREVGLDASIEDSFPEIGLTVTTTAKFVTFKRSDNSDLGVPISDLPKLVQALRDAATLARQLP